MSGLHRIPSATYRLQLGQRCTFADAAALVPWLDELGVSHLYCSPYLKARQGSPHGYDVTDHHAFQPEIGGAAGFERLVAALERRGMGHIMDLVSNHMGVGGDDNAWWLDILEHGPASPRAHYFDIHWQPVLRRLRGKVLLPILDDHYGAVLERGDLRLGFDPACGSLHFGFHHHHLPLDPATYPLVLDEAADQVASAATRADLERISLTLAALPTRDAAGPTARERRVRQARESRHELAALCAAAPAVAVAIRDAADACNGEPAVARSFDRLHELFEAQAYRLAHWRVAADEINYRRFFDINDLACLRLKEPEVFDAVHGLVRRLTGSGALQGLRIDHVDGVFDPAEYTRRLREFFPGYLVVEKILASHEQLPADWPVEGTTGYEFAEQLDAVLLDPAGEQGLTRLYRRFVGAGEPFAEVLLQSKRLVIHSHLSSELTMLASLADAIAQSDRHTRDFTLNGLRDALAEIVASFPVYRTYVGPHGASEEDRQSIDMAVQQALRRAPVEDAPVYGFLRALLLQAPVRPHDPTLKKRVEDFVQRFQQYTVPVMAKGLEDTAGYRYNRLVCRNEVGGDPTRFSLSLRAFHKLNGDRARFRPHGLLAASTHDSKRSEDVRARLAVLTEWPGIWQQRVFRWSRLNRRFRREVDGQRVPSRNDEYLFYQTLLGTWVTHADEPAGREAFIDRMVGCMHKAVREAKTHTSWSQPDPEYEAGIEHFVRRTLGLRRHNAFLADFRTFQRQVARLGACNSLAQTVVRLTAPGVPDLYQGNELWRFDLMDPDNRRVVDFDRRRELLRELQELVSAPDAAARIKDLAQDLTDDRVKLLVIWRALRLRRLRQGLYRDGDYRPLTVTGPAREHICAFARTLDESWTVTAILRWPARLLGADADVSRARRYWGDTRVELPEVVTGDGAFDVMSAATVPWDRQDGGAAVLAADLFRTLPVTLLCPDDPFR
ncbi:MAG: malto-oligosyltrehalose synthase [Gammaproteobacteria bacterium]|nr:MAG: malto-oligosyltrehalose synthase [Gammaproteobacteria bacterium]